MAEPTKVLRFPHKQKLRLVWDSSSAEVFVGPQKPEYMHHPLSEPTSSASTDTVDEDVQPKKPE